MVGYQAMKNQDGSTGFGEVVGVSAVACKLSFESAPATVPSDGASALSQSVKVFLAPDVVVAPGSKLVITQDGVTTAYQSSGQPVRHPTHQELALELFRGWA